MVESFIAHSNRSHNSTYTGHSSGQLKSNGAGGVQGFSLEQVVFRVLAWSNGAGGVQGFGLEQVVFRVLALCASKGGRLIKGGSIRKLNSIFK